MKGDKNNVKNGGNHCRLYKLACVVPISYPAAKTGRCERNGGGGGTARTAPTMSVFVGKNLMAFRNIFSDFLHSIDRLRAVNEDDLREEMVSASLHIAGVGSATASFLLL